MLEGAIRHGTTMEVEGNYVDSHGQSEVGSASPGCSGSTCCRGSSGSTPSSCTAPRPGEPDASPRLQAALTRPIRWDVIAEQYDQMIKYAAAIRSCTASTEAILRRFAKPNSMDPSYQA